MTFARLSAAFCYAALAFGLCASPALARDPMSARLQADRMGSIEPGTYQAGDTVMFTLEPHGQQVLLRFDGDPEVFALHAGQASLGGRVLKYDSGSIAIAVSGWGGVTLYTDEAPSGLPAVRVDAPLPPPPDAPSLAALRAIMQDEAERLALARRLQIGFTADWNALARDPALWQPAQEAIENAARGVERFTAAAAARQAMIRHVNTIKIEAGSPTFVGLSGKTLVITIDPQRGYAGRASSRVVARTLAGSLGIVPLP